MGIRDGLTGKLSNETQGMEVVSKLNEGSEVQFYIRSALGGLDILRWRVVDSSLHNKLTTSLVRICIV